MKSEVLPQIKLSGGNEADWDGSNFDTLHTFGVLKRPWARHWVLSSWALDPHISLHSFTFYIPNIRIIFINKMHLFLCQGFSLNPDKSRVTFDANPNKSDGSWDFFPFFFDILMPSTECHSSYRKKHETWYKSISISTLFMVLWRLEVSGCLRDPLH